MAFAVFVMAIHRNNAAVVFVATIPVVMIGIVNIVIMKIVNLAFAKLLILN